MPKLLLLPFFLCLLAGCSGEDGLDGPISCSDHEDCPGTMFCILGECKTTSCAADSDCPEGFRCLATGACKKNVECEKNQDCPPGKSCIDYACTGTTCSPEGTTTPCFIGCHEGKKHCSNGDWGACDAPSVQAGEVCGNGLDDDCNGLEDDGCLQCTPQDPPQPCENECGEGTRPCEDGIWGECSAGTDCLCEEPGAVEEEPCGNCGTMTRMCKQVGESTNYRWEDFGACKAEGICPPGELDQSDCGTMCGTQTRECQENCTWGEWGECEDEGICSPAATEDKPCLNCGIQTKVCGEDCLWEPWGACQENAGCKSGESESKPCGNCGTSTRFCDSDCQWGEWGSCTGEGVCAPGAKESASCSYCGTKERSCTQQCAWGAWGSCKNGGDCSPGDSQTQSCGPTTEKGICKKGQQNRTCNNSCLWNPWGSCLGAVYPATEVCGDGTDQDCSGSDKTQPDQYESNNTCGSCHWISGEDPVVTLGATFDTGGAHVGGTDTNDYFCFKSVDNFNIWPTAEHIKVALKKQPLGIDGDLFLYKGLSNCTADKPLKSSVTIGGADESIDWEESGDDDTATYYVRVQNWSDKGNCYQTYTLDIQGLK